MKLNNLVDQIYFVAVNEAKLGCREYITPECFLYAILMFDEGKKLIESLGGDCQILTDELDNHFETLEKKEAGSPIESEEFVEMLVVAKRIAFHFKTEEVGLSHILIAMFAFEDDMYGAAGIALTRSGVYIEAINRLINPEDPDGITKPYEYEGHANPAHRKSPNLLVNESRVESRALILDKYAIELTKRAKEGKLDPLIGRKNELKDMELILCRRIKNNLLLVGDAGVGKTALVEGLAQKIAEGSVPSALKNAIIYQLDMGAVISGTKYRGEFEERLLAIFSEAAAMPNVILYMDEIHSSATAGNRTENAMGAAHFIKQYLTMGRLRFIGTTTDYEFKKYIEKDNAFVRRFQKIDIAEPTKQEAIKILQGVRHKYENHHGVEYSDEAIKAAVDLSHKHLHDLRLPDKAIDIIDMAAVEVAFNAQRCRAGDYYRFPIVDVDDIKWAIAQMAKIPMESVDADEKSSLANLQNVLLGQVYGQDAAVEAVATAIKAARFGLNDPIKPVASLLFVGPTGVGKTQLAQSLAKAQNIPLIRLDMSEYQERHAVSRLIGAPPGYEGYQEGGLLTDAIRKTPHAVLLLDEIEKAHHKIMNVLLQVMDYGILTDTTGKKADFRNAIIIMTSNAGAAQADKKVIGFTDEKNYGAMGEEVLRTFAPEFRNRLNQIIYFNKINEEMALKIAKKAINTLNERLEQKGIKLYAEESALKHIAKKGCSDENGARKIIAMVEGPVKDKLANALVNDEGGNCYSIKLDDNNEFYLENVDNEIKSDNDDIKPNNNELKPNRTLTF